MIKRSSSKYARGAKATAGITDTMKISTTHILLEVSNQTVFNAFCKVAQAIQAMVPGATVLKNSVPKEWAMADIYCQLIPNQDDNNPYYDVMPRIGAFEVSYKGVVSFFFYSIFLFLVDLLKDFILDVASLLRFR